MIEHCGRQPKSVVWEPIRHWRNQPLRWKSEIPMTVGAHWNGGRDEDGGICVWRGSVVMIRLWNETSKGYLHRLILLHLLRPPLLHHLLLPPLRMWWWCWWEEDGRRRWGMARKSLGRRKTHWGESDGRRREPAERKGAPKMRRWSQVGGAG